MASSLQFKTCIITEVCNHFLNPPYTNKSIKSTDLIYRHIKQTYKELSEEDRKIIIMCVLNLLWYKIE